MAARMLSTDWLAVGAEDGLFLSFLATAILFYATQTSIVHLWGTERAVLEELLHIPQTKLVANKHVSSKAKSRDICDDINLKVSIHTVYHRREEANFPTGKRNKGSSLLGFTRRYGRGNRVQVCLGAIKSLCRSHCCL